MNSSSSTDRVDVAVIGAGPTGLSLASLLAMDGLEVAVIDHGRLPIAHPRATHLDDETMRTFQTLGLQSLEPNFSPVGIYRFYDPQWRPVMAMAMDRGLTEQGWQSDYMFHQPDFEAVLRGRLNDAPNVGAWFGWDVKAVEDDGDGVRIGIRDASSGEEREVVADYAVGCDGAKSLVRRTMGCTETNFQATHRSLVIDILPFVQPESLPSRDAFIQGGVRNPLTYIPIAAPRLRFELMLRPEDDTLAFQRVAHAHAALSPWFRSDEYRILRTDVYEWNAIVASPWRAGRLLLAGDAAHQMPPHLGQGMCSGIRDALNLSWKLRLVARGEAPSGLLDTYESERSPHVTTMVAISAEMANGIEKMDLQGSDDGSEPEVQENDPVRPPLGPGVRADRVPAGTLSAQPVLSDGRLLDDALGYRFTVVGDPACIAAASERSRQLWRDLDAAVLDEPHDEVISWVRELDGKVVILRPDRFIFGVAGDAEALDELTALLGNQLALSGSA